MRVIEKEIIDAVREKKNLKTARDEIIYSPERSTTDVYLHGNKVAVIGWDSKDLTVSDCGWPTHTTHRRINAVFAALNLGCSVCLMGGCSFWSIKDTGDWIVEHR